MDTNNEILDAIEILVDKKIGENITKVLTGICTSVNINKSTCVMNSNGVSGTVYFYGSPPEVNGLYRIFVPSNDMSRSFIVVPPRFTVNPNLLDNWYFVNPVNQGGQTEYTGSGYMVDRWTSGGDTISIVDTGVQIISTGPGRVTQQLISGDLQKSLAGKTVTFSVLADADILGDWVITDTNGFSTSHRDVVFQGNLASWTFTVSDNTNIGGLGVWCTSAGKTITLIAAKLELGPTQTLAHLENGNWVLNEIPVYSDQLARCQRYMLQLVNTIDNYEILGGGAAMNTTQVFAFAPTPVSLFKKPFVLNRTGRFVLVRNTAASDGIPITGIGVDHVSSNGVSLVCTVDTSLDVGEYYSLWCVPNDVPNSLIISANL